MIQLLQATTANKSIMLQDGKIYMVMTIVTIILTGLFLYVASLDKKISQLEK
jgi:CcmD family protein